MTFASGRKGDIAGPYIIMGNKRVIGYSLVWIESEDELVG